MNTKTPEAEFESIYRARIRLYLAKLNAPMKSNFGSELKTQNDLELYAALYNFAVNVRKYFATIDKDVRKQVTKAHKRKQRPESVNDELKSLMEKATRDKYAYLEQQQQNLKTSNVVSENKMRELIESSDIEPPSRPPPPNSLPDYNTLYKTEQIARAPARPPPLRAPAPVPVQRPLSFNVTQTPLSDTSEKNPLIRELETNIRKMTSPDDYKNTMYDIIRRRNTDNVIVAEFYEFLNKRTKELAQSDPQLSNYLAQLAAEAYNAVIIFDVTYTKFSDPEKQVDLFSQVIRFDEDHTLTDTEKWNISYILWSMFYTDADRMYSENKFVDDAIKTKLRAVSDEAPMVNSLVNEKSIHKEQIEKLRDGFSLWSLRIRLLNKWGDGSRYQNLVKDINDVYLQLQVRLKPPPPRGGWLW